MAASNFAKFKTIGAWAIVIVGAGLFLLGKYLPEQADKAGLGWTKQLSAPKDRRETTWYKARLGGPIQGHNDPKDREWRIYEYELDFVAKKPLVLYDMTVALIEKAERESGRKGRTTWVRSNLHSDRLVSDSGQTLKAGQRFTRKGTIRIGRYANGYKRDELRSIAVRGNIRYADDAPNQSENSFGEKYRLELDAQRN